MPFGAAHTYIAYIRDYPPPHPLPGRKTRCILGVSLLTQARLRLVPSRYLSVFGG